jgi:hypothetical protein
VADVVKPDLQRLRLLSVRALLELDELSARCEYAIERVNAPPWPANYGANNVMVTRAVAERTRARLRYLLGHEGPGPFCGLRGNFFRQPPWDLLAEQ